MKNYKCNECAHDFESDLPYKKWQGEAFIKKNTISNIEPKYVCDKCVLKMNRLD